MASPALDTQYLNLVFLLLRFEIFMNIMNIKAHAVHTLGFCQDYIQRLLFWLPSTLSAQTVGSEGDRVGTDEGRAGCQVRTGWRVEEWKVNNESVPKSFPDREEEGFGEASGALVSLWLPRHRTAGVWKSKPQVTVNIPSAAAELYPKTSTRLPPLCQSSQHQPCVTSSCMSPLTEYISGFVHSSPFSLSPSHKPAPVPSSGKAHFWFPYKSQLWSVEGTWSHYSSSRKVTSDDSE